MVTVLPTCAPVPAPYYCAPRCTRRQPSPTPPTVPPQPLDCTKPLPHLNHSLSRHHQQQQTESDLADSSAAATTTTTTTSATARANLHTPILTESHRRSLLDCGQSTPACRHFLPSIRTLCVVVCFLPILFLLSASIRRENKIIKILNPYHSAAHTSVLSFLVCEK